MIYLLLIPIVFLTIFLHELGHALAGRWCGFVVTSFGIGFGRPIAVWNRRGTRIFLCGPHTDDVTSFLGGIAIAHSRDIIPLRRAQLGFVLGGLLANTACVICGLALWQFLPESAPVALMFVGVNAMMATTNALPFRIDIGALHLQSDGFQIRSIIPGRSSIPAPGMVLQQAEGAVKLLKSIGDNEAVAYRRFSIAGAYLQLGDAATARTIYQEALALPGLETSLLRAQGLWFLAYTEANLGLTEESAANRREAERLFTAQGNAVGLAWIRCHEARRQARQGAGERASAILDELEADPAVTARQALRHTVFVARLETTCAVQDIVKSEALLARYETERRQHASPVQDLNVYRAAAAMYAREKKLDKALTYYSGCLAAARRIYVTCDEENLRHSFREIQGALLTEAKTCLEAVDKATEAATISDFFLKLEADLPNAAQRQRQIAQTAERRNRKLFLCSLLISTIGVAVGFLFARSLNATAQVNASVSFLLLGVFSLFALAANVLFFALRHFGPGLQTRSGSLNVVLALLPWLVSLLLRLSM